MTEKDERLKEAETAYAELRQAVAGLDEDRMSRIWLGSWGVREILIHVAGWEREMTPALERVARGAAPYPDGAYDDADGWNARFVEARRGAKPPEILAELDATHRGFMTAAAALPESLLAKEGAARGLFDGSGPDHYREHADQIRAWRQTVA
jgi:hypothetical protein